jgi:hypothetical protein
VAYACWQNPIGLNLYNRDGLPASPFYVDNVAAKYKVTATAGPGGTLTPAGTTTYLQRKTAHYTITPEADNYLQDVLVDGVSVGAVTEYTFDPLDADHTLAATFTNTLPSHTINAWAGPGGSMSPTGLVAVAQGGAQTFTLTPNPGCATSLVVDGRPMGARSSFGFADTRTDHRIVVTFTCALKAAAVAGGRIAPSGTLVVPAGTNLTFTITPNNYYQTANVQVDGVSQGAVAAYTFTNVTAPHTIGAGFALLPPTLTILRNANGGLDLTWPDIYSSSLLWSPVLGPGTAWNPAAITPVVSGGFRRVTLPPNAARAFYGLGPSP